MHVRAAAVLAGAILEDQIRRLLERAVINDLKGEMTSQ